MKSMKVSDETFDENFDDILQNFSGNIHILGVLFYYILVRNTLFSYLGTYMLAFIRMRPTG
jgi:hypothetical protein